MAGFLLYFYFKTPSSTTPGGEGIGTNFISQFNPFATKPKPPVEKPPVDVSGYVPPATEETDEIKLVRISSMPIAGFGSFTKERLKEIIVVDPTITPENTENIPITTKTKTTPPATEFMTAVRYVEKASGNIYQSFVDKINEKKFSKTTIPKVYDAYFGNKAESVVMRYLKTDNSTIETFLGSLPKEFLGTDPNLINDIKGSFLPNNVKDISISPDGSKMFYLFESGDNIIGTTLNFLTNKKVQIFDSPFTEWLAQWGSNKIISLTTKPNSNIPGYVYNIDDTGKNLTKVLGDINGLTTLSSPNGKLILYANNNLTLNIYHTDTKNTDVLGVRTLPEKCVWSKLSDAIYCAVPKFIPTGNYPDSWYQGEVSFTDQFWKIDAKTSNGSIVIDPNTTTAEEIDGTRLALDEGQNYLLFINKKDSFLWRLDLK